ncbi:MAG: Biotin carboxyl carrier protein of acetyl-CoA carboxylase [Phycisphaerae bacterium]|nr:Biotin carboxyl carrier protein of acetyl-CoA carboxylase [Phycisphaerae bacterium]
MPDTRLHSMEIDTDKIKTLLELMVQHDVSRIEIAEGESRILLRRGHTPSVIAPAITPQPFALAPNPGPAAAPAAPTASSPVAEETFIRSPMVGTFYTAPDPESPAFVQSGEIVTPDRVVCLIEAMKVFNEIKAEVSGRITRVLVKNAQAVEYDQPLFAIVAT